MDTSLKASYIKRAVVFVICIAGACVCTYFVVSGKAAPFDDAVRYFMYDLRSPVLNAFLIPITYLGNWQIITGLSVILILIKNTRKDIGLRIGISALVSDLINKFVKYNVKRTRPDKALHLVKQGGYSFPSGHSMTGLVFYAMLAYTLRQRILSEDSSEKGVKKARILTVSISALIFLIGISRIYVGVHFPTDVLTGWFIGGAFFTLITSLHPEQS